MKHFKVILAVVVVLALFSGCASLAGTFGIASTAYVDEQLTMAREELAVEIKSNAMGIGENTSKLDQFTESATQLEELIVSIQQTVETTDELKQLADVLENRLENLPVETIRQLVGILDQYLEGK